MSVKVVAARFSHFSRLSVPDLWLGAWSAADAPLRDAAKIDDPVSGIEEKFALFVEDPLRSKFGSQIVIDSLYRPVIEGDGAP